MTVDNEKKHHAMHKNSRIELKCATMTVEKESQVYEMHKKSRTELGQKPPGQKPPGQKPPGQKPPGQKPPRQNILFRNFITFVFRMSYGKEISVWFLAVKYVRYGSIK